MISFDGVVVPVKTNTVDCVPYILSLTFSDNRGGNTTDFHGHKETVPSASTLSSTTMTTYGASGGSGLHSSTVFASPLPPTVTQFSFNSDYPGVRSDGASPDVSGTTFAESLASDPHEFPIAQPTPCARITTRIYHPTRNQVMTVQNVLVRTGTPKPLSIFLSTNATTSGTSGDPHTSAGRDPLSFQDEDLSDGTFSSSSSSSHGSLMEDDSGNRESGGNFIDGSVAGAIWSDCGVLEEDRAYWVQRTIREAIYGRVFFAIILRRRRNINSRSGDNCEWEATNQHCAVKEMSWQHIRKERDRLAEDPIKEVAAMQYLKQWHRTLQLSMSHGPQHDNTSTPILRPQAPVQQVMDGVALSFSAILQTNIMMPLDLLSDDGNLYSIMPYCSGGELFDRLDSNERFPEAEARYWMHQIMNVSLERARGLCVMAIGEL
jgi:hypothetical protein